jgi:NDP-sugar pyrophosphorylase family protein
MFLNHTFFDLNNTDSQKFLSTYSMPWIAIKNIGQYLNDLIGNKNSFIDISTNIHKTANLEGSIYIGKNVTIEANVSIKGPVYIGDNVYIGNNSLIRPNTLLSPNSKIGYSCEIKNSIILENARVSHFCFIGDSIIGQKTNLGSRMTTANFPHTSSLLNNNDSISVNYGTFGVAETGLHHFGAVIGDNCRIGCHTVLNPGTILGKNVETYPSMSIKGYIPSDSKVKQPYNLIIESKKESQNIIAICAPLTEHSRHVF